MFTVYILYSKTADRYYIGQTDNLQARIENHNRRNDSEGKYTRKNGPWELVYHESGFTNRAKAMKREKQIKSWKSRMKIEELISGFKTGQ